MVAGWVADSGDSVDESRTSKSRRLRGSRFRYLSRDGTDCSTIVHGHLGLVSSIHHIHQAGYSCARRNTSVENQMQPVCFGACPLRHTKAAQAADVEAPTEAPTAAVEATAAVETAAVQAAGVAGWGDLVG